MPLTLRAVLSAALACGLLAGLVFFAAQSVTTRPLIVQAEIYEHAAAAPAPVHAHTHDHDAAAHEHAAPAGEWQPEEGIERTSYTLAAAVLIGIGYAFLLVGAVTMSGRAVTPLTGLAWGAAGYLAFFAAPSWGLPPEPPGAQAADLLLRQVWWLGTAALTSVGLGLLLLGRGLSLRIAGAAVILTPQLIGAPHLLGGAEQHPDLASSFVLASAVANAALWLSLGLGTGTLLPFFAGRNVLAPSGQTSAG